MRLLLALVGLWATATTAVSLRRTTLSWSTALPSKALSSQSVIYIDVVLHVEPESHEAQTDSLDNSFLTNHTNRPASLSSKTYSHASMSMLPSDQDGQQLRTKTGDISRNSLSSDQLPPRITTFLPHTSAQALAFGTSLNNNLSASTRLRPLQCITATNLGGMTHSWSSVASAIYNESGFGNNQSRGPSRSSNMSIFTGMSPPIMVELPRYLITIMAAVPLILMILV